MVSDMTIISEMLSSITVHLRMTKMLSMISGKISVQSYIKNDENVLIKTNVPGMVKTLSVITMISGMVTMLSAVPACNEEHLLRYFT